MSQWLENQIAEIRELMRLEDEASLWTLFFDEPEGAPAVTSVIDGAMAELDRELLRRYSAVTASVGAAAVLVAVIRRDGRPRTEDRQLWRDLRDLLRDGPTRLLAFVVVGTASHWAAASDGDLGTAA